jgi:hypothetical protein
VDTPKKAHAFVPRQARSFPGLDLVRRHPVPRLRDLQIPSEPRDRMLAGAVLVDLASQLDRSTTELRRMRSRHTDSLPAATTAHGRCPEERVNSIRRLGAELRLGADGATNLLTGEPET